MEWVCFPRMMILKRRAAESAEQHACVELWTLRSLRLCVSKKTGIASQRGDSEQQSCQSGYCEERSMISRRASEAAGFQRKSKVAGNSMR